MADANQALLEQILRDVQARLTSIEQTLSAHGGKLDTIDRKIDDLEYGVNQAVGLASRAVARAAEANTNTHGLERRLEDLATRVAALERAR